MSLVDIKTGKESYPGAVLGAWTNWDCNTGDYTRFALVADPKWGLITKTVARQSRGASGYKNFSRVVVDADEFALRMMRESEEWYQTYLNWGLHRCLQLVAETI